MPRHSKLICLTIAYFVLHPVAKANDSPFLLESISTRGEKLKTYKLIDKATSKVCLIIFRNEDYHFILDDRFPYKMSLEILENSGYSILTWHGDNNSIASYKIYSEGKVEYSPTITNKYRQKLQDNLGLLQLGISAESDLIPKS